MIVRRWEGPLLAVFVQEHELERFGVRGWHGRQREEVVARAQLLLEQFTPSGRPSTALEGLEPSVRGAHQFDSDGDVDVGPTAGIVAQGEISSRAST